MKGGSHLLALTDISLPPSSHSSSFFHALVLEIVSKCDDCPRFASAGTASPSDDQMGPWRRRFPCRSGYRNTAFHFLSGFLTVGKICLRRIHSFITTLAVGKNSQLFQFNIWTFWLYETSETAFFFFFFRSSRGRNDGIMDLKKFLQFFFAPPSALLRVRWNSSFRPAGSLW